MSTDAITFRAIKMVASIAVMRKLSHFRPERVGQKGSGGPETHRPE